MYEKLYGDARVNPVPIQCLDPRTADDLADARDLVRETIQAGTSADELAKRTGIKVAAIKAFVADQWTGSASTHVLIAADLSKAINALRREQAADDSDVREFAWTRMAEAIRAVAAYCVKRKRIGLVTAPAGSGKSIVLDALLAEHVGAVKLTITEGYASRSEFLRLLAESLRIARTGNSAVRQERILRALAGTSRPIFIDEAHKLSVPALDTMREVWDAANVPILLAATPTLHAKITSRRIDSERSELLDQLSSRVAIWRDLTFIENEQGKPGPRFTVADVRKVFERGRLRLAPDGAAFLAKLASADGAGGLRSARDMVQLVIDLWPGDPLVTRERLLAALNTRMGVREAGFYVSMIESTDGKEARIAVG